MSDAASASAVVIDEPITYPGAVRPDRHRWVNAHGVRLAVCEWGKASAPPLFLVHGGADFAGTFDVLAPRLAAGGWRVISWDHRGHGDSDHAALYSWDADVRDALAVLDATTAEPVRVAAHSKGGLLMLQLAEALPSRIGRLAIIDGFPAPRPAPDVSNHERRGLTEKALAQWLDHRRDSAAATRKPGTLDELARRRAKANPRLPMDWLRYLVPIGAHRGPDGWRWKLDPAIRFGGFGPWRPEWSLKRLHQVQAPLFGLTATVKEQLGSGVTAGQLAPYLPSHADVRPFPDAGHFIHVEHPQAVSDLLLEFFA